MNKNIINKMQENNDVKEEFCQVANGFTTAFCGKAKMTEKGFKIRNFPESCCKHNDKELLTA